jgi:hypothetical protein
MGLAVRRGAAMHMCLTHFQIGGVVLFLVYLGQVTLGLYIHRRKPKERAGQHPPRNILHIVFGLATIGLAFWQV